MEGEYREDRGRLDGWMDGWRECGFEQQRGEGGGCVTTREKLEGVARVCAYVD